MTAHNTHTGILVRATPALATLAIQFMLAAWTFPLNDVLSTKPLLTIDAAYHWYQMNVAMDLAVQGHLTGYDPMFAAGHIGGVVMNPSGKVPALLAVLLREVLTVEQSYKLFVFGASLFGPLCVPWACRIWRLGLNTSLLASALGLLLWWVSAFRWYHTAGMVSFVCASYVALPFAALFLRAAVASESRIAGLVGTGLLGAFGFLLHPLFPLLVLFPIFAQLPSIWREIDLGRVVVAAIVIGALSLAPNLPWLLMLLETGSGEIGAQPYQQRVDLLMVIRELLAKWDGGAMGSKVYSGLLAASILGAFLSKSVVSRRFAIAGLAAWAAMELFAWGGAAIPGVGSLQPNRFAVAAYVLLIIPSAVAIVQIKDDWAVSGHLLRLCMGSVLVVCALSTTFAVWEATREVSYRPFGHYGAPPPAVRGVGPTSAWIAMTLSEHTNSSGRVFFETSLARVHDNAHMAGYLARVTEREFIGGPYTYMFTAGFWDGVAFGRSLRSVTEDELRRYFNAFNIGWIVAHSDPSKQYFATIPWIVPMRSDHDVVVYRVDQELSYFFSGGGVVEKREVNRLVLSGLRDSSVAIKYRYVPGLKVVPAGHAEPYPVEGIAEPFVKVSGIAGQRIELSLE